MKKQFVVLRPEELSRLSAVVGQAWEYWGAPTMTVPTHAVMEVFVRTAESALTILTDLVPLDFAGYPDEYTSISVVGGERSLKEAATAGNLFYHHRGKVIRDVLVVRDTVRETRSGELTFELTSDMAIVFVFDESCLAFVKGGYSIEDFFIMSGPDIDSLAIEDHMGFWEPDLERSYSCSRRVVSAADLVVET